MQSCCLLLTGNNVRSLLLAFEIQSVIFTFFAGTRKYRNLLIIVIGQLDLSDTIWLETSYSMKVSSLPVRDYISLWFVFELLSVKYYFFPDSMQTGANHNHRELLHTHKHMHTLCCTMLTSGKLSKLEPKGVSWTNNKMMEFNWHCDCVHSGIY